MSQYQHILDQRETNLFIIFAENEDSLIAYVSQQNLLHDENLDPCSHPQIETLFEGIIDGKYILKNSNIQ